MDPNEDFFIVLSDDCSEPFLPEEKLREIIASHRGTMVDLLRTVEAAVLAETSGINKRHPSLFDAEARAEALAKASPGKRFYVAQIDRYAYFQGAKIYRLGIPF